MMLQKKTVENIIKVGNKFLIIHIEYEYLETQYPQNQILHLI